MYVPREVAEKRLWSDLDEFLEYMARRGVVIVVGSYWPLPLILDRPLAELLAYRLGEGSFWPIVLTDELLYRPLHRIGDPSALRDRDSRG